MARPELTSAALYPAALTPRFSASAGPSVDADHALLGASERMFASLRRFTPTNVARVIVLDGVLAPAQIVRALELLHARHPLLRARIEAGEAPRFLFERAGPPTLQLIGRRDDAHWQHALEQALNTQIEAASGSHCMVLYLSAPSTRRSELILLVDHTISDGVSVNQLCAELLALCTAPTQRVARARLPVLEGMLPEFGLVQRAGHTAAVFSDFAAGSLLRALFERRGAAQRTSYRFSELTSAETNALRRRARLQGTTLTGALMAASLLSVRGVRGVTPYLGLSVPIDLRPRLPGRLAPEDLGNYTSVAYMVSRAAGDAWPLARVLKARLDRHTQPERLLSTVPAIFRSGRRLVGPRRAPHAHVMLSNSGLVPLRQRYGTLGVRGFYSADSAPMLSADFSFFCNTFDARLTLNLVFSEELASRHEAEDVLESMRGRLSAMGR